MRHLKVFILYIQALFALIITGQNNVKTVNNLEIPLYKSEFLSIKEDLSIGGEKSRTYQESLSLVIDICVGLDGRIYVADYKSSEIKIFDKFGNFLRTFGKKGQGPGEFIQLQELSFCTDINKIFVHDRRRGHFFDPDGNYVKDIAYRNNYFSVKADSKGRLTGLAEIRNENKYKAELFLINENGNPGISLAQSPPIDMSVDNPYQPTLIWCLRPDNTIVEGYAESYEFYIYNPDGTRVLHVRKSYHPVEVTIAEREAYTNSNLESFRNRKYNFSRFHSAYNWLMSDEDGRIYARTWERTPDGKLSLFDIFNNEGIFLGKVAWPSGALVIRKGKLYSSEKDSGQYPIIKRYQLSWKQ
jgi:hypothetical protein